MQKWIPDKKQTDVAVAACKVLGLDFAGVDLLLDADDEPLICEVNSNAHFKTLFDCTGVDTADAIIKYIIRSIK
jgi:glutathione synthase/RimK-type ligase-like ATP-grasp enzyme